MSKDKIYLLNKDILDKTKIKNTYGIEIPYWEDSLRECINKMEI